MRFPSLASTLALGLALVAAAPAQEEGLGALGMGAVQEAGGFRVRVYVGREDRPIADARLVPVLMDVETAVVRVDLHPPTGTAPPEQLTVRFPEEPAASLVASRVPRPSEEFVDYPAADGFVYEVRVPVSRVHQDPGDTTNETYSIFRTTENDDTLTFRKGLEEQPGPPYALPHRQLLFVDNSDYTGGLEGPGGVMSCSDLHGASGCETFSSGAVRPVPFQILHGGSALGRSALLVERVPDWIYFSGHYPRGAGGHLDGARIYPEDIPGVSWPGRLEVLVFASCYAVEINSLESIEGYLGAGIDGARWWGKFEGTLLGYRHLAPSDAASAVTRDFLRRVRASEVSASGDPDGWSRMVAGAWMDANKKYWATNAAAVDTAGRYYFTDDRNIHLEGVEYRSGIDWETIERSAWEPQYQRTVAAYGADAVVWDIQEVLRPIDGPPRTPEEVLAHPRYAEVARRKGLDPANPELRSRVREEVQEARRVYYQEPDEWTYRTAIGWILADLDGVGPPSVEEVKEHFRVEDPDITPAFPPDADIAEWIYQEYSNHLFASASTYDFETGTTTWETPPEELFETLAVYYDVTPERRASLEAMWIREEEGDDATTEW